MGVAAPVVPWWAWLLARLPFGSQRENVFDFLSLRLGFWDLNDGDWYVNGRWNWRCWEHFERHGWPADQLPVFPRLMKKVFGR